jgi:hypothetical protein
VGGGRREESVLPWWWDWDREGGHITGHGFSFVKLTAPCSPCSLALPGWLGAKTATLGYPQSSDYKAFRVIATLQRTTANPTALSPRQPPTLRLPAAGDCMPALPDLA